MNSDAADTKNTRRTIITSEILVSFFFDDNNNNWLFLSYLEATFGFVLRELQFYPF